MSFHNSVNFASLVAPCAPAARRLLSLSSLSQIAQNGDPMVCYLKRILSGQRVLYFSSGASLIDQPSVYCICWCTCGGALLVMFKCGFEIRGSIIGSNK